VTKPLLAPDWFAQAVSRASRQVTGFPRPNASELFADALWDDLRATRATRDPEMDYEMRDRMLAIASSNLAARAARPPSDCACGWPGCSGQCHTGTSCPCHPMTTDSQWGGKRLYQCPGCWSWGIWPNPVDGDNECECGERLMCVDLREYALREALAALAATREEMP